MSESTAGPEPTLAEVQAEYPEWMCREEISGLFYAQHKGGTHVHGEDPLDLRDQIKMAEARAAAGGTFGFTASL